MVSLRKRFRWLTLLLAPLAVASCVLAADWWHAVPAGTKATYVGRSTCLECHAQQHQQWTGSDHDLAMDLANEETVLGDFDDAEYTYYGMTSKMFRQGDKFSVTTEGSDGTPQTYDVKYTFGVRPLQQYLVQFDDGRVQVLPLAWDTKDKRWFHLYPDEQIAAGDLLHWTGPMQNWNHMCAECHSTNLQKNFDVDSNTYHTTFSEIDVSCEACHGPGSIHVDLARGRSLFWDRRYGYALARLKDENPRVEIETCAPCHSRRRVVHGGFRPGDDFLDYYAPEMLERGMYYADGQILEEDYAYGSFIQSLMYHKGVRCTDCHDPHTTKLKAQGNALCNRCHEPGKYDGPAHHHHQVDSTGAACVECHMPERTYMQVDPRRDHSLRVPRPDLTIALAVPNACNRCHRDQSPEWAQENIEKWYGKPVRRETHFAHAIAGGLEGSAEARQPLEKLVAKQDVPAIVRASAAALLAQYPDREPSAAITAALDDPDPLVRAAAVGSLAGAPRDQLTKLLPPKLSDPVRLVRVEAARVLSQVAPSGGPLGGRLMGAGGTPETIAFSPEDQRAFDAALDEFIAGQLAEKDQAGAHLNLGVLRANQGRLEEAIREYKTAVRIDPDFIPARVNLAMLYVQQAELSRDPAKKADAEELFREAIQLSPKLAGAPGAESFTAQLHYSLGLLIAEDDKRFDEAAEELAEAARLAPGNARIRYNLGQALQSLGRLKAAQVALEAAVELAPDQVDFVFALAFFFSENGMHAQAIQAYQDAVRLSPREPALRFRFGVALEQAGELHKAEKSLLAAHRLQPDNPDFLYAVISYYVRQRRYADALPFAEALAFVRPDQRVLLDEIRRKAAE